MKDIVSLLGLGGEQSLVGSFARRTLFPSDIDVFEQVRLRGTEAHVATTVAERLQNMVRRLIHQPNVRVVEVKLGGSVEAPQRWSARQVLGLTRAEVAELLTQPAKLKVDLVCWFDSLARFVDVGALTAVYADGVLLNWAPADDTSSLQDDEREYARSGDWWKALKRHYSRLRISGGGATVMDRLETFFDGPAGALAQIVHDLDTLAECAAHHVDLPRRKLQVELEGIELRLGRIDLNGLTGLQPRIAAALKKLIAALPVRRKASLVKLGRVATRVSVGLDRVLQGQARKVYRKLKRA